MLSVALVGYTNAGKSSILRGLSGQHEIVVEDRLFATLDTLTREVDLGEGQRARVTDTVGFIRKLPHHLVASFRATLEEVRGADVLLHVVDASHPDWEGQMRVVERVLAELDLADRPLIPVFNKMDAVADPASFTQRVRALHPTGIPATSMRTDGLARPEGRFAGPGTGGQAYGAGQSSAGGRRPGCCVVPGWRGALPESDGYGLRVCGPARGVAGEPAAGGGSYGGGRSRNRPAGGRSAGVVEADSGSGTGRRRAEGA